MFELKLPSSPGGAWAEAILRDFGAVYSGYAPVGGIAIGHDGSLYGATIASGGGHQCGNVFQLVPREFLSSAAGSWEENVLFEQFLVTTAASRQA